MASSSSSTTQPQSGRIALIGAGPGDPGLLTLRGRECLQQADVVLYDYLAGPRLLEHARPDAELHCLGRHGQGKLWKQPQINNRMVALALAGITLLVVVHELGHFLAAKYYKVGVETFSLGFGPKIFKFVRNGTTYCVSALPLGGYVKMFGDDPGKDIPLEDQQRSYLHKPVAQRIVVTLAGPLMNLFFAGFLFTASFSSHPCFSRKYP